MRQRFNVRQKNYIIFGLCGILLVMAAGYAAFRSQLTINGTSNITSDWKVLITDIQSSVLAGDATDAEAPTHTETTATFKTNLVSPGDSMQYDITVENQGDIDAVLKTLSKTDSSNDAIIFQMTGIEQGDTLKSHESTTFNVIVTYNPEITNQPANLTSDLTITLDYVQAGTTDEGEVLPSETNIMRSYTGSSQLDYHSDEYREKITSIEFLNNKNIPSEAVQSWDVSERQDGSVMAWIINDTENAGYYKLYIGGDGGVTANPNSGYLFYKFIEVKSIELKNLDTSYVENMESMFNTCTKLTSLDLSNFDTSNVTDMKNMFNTCTELTSLDLSSFNTSNVTDIGGMFSADSKLKSLDICSFNTSSVTDMSWTFNELEEITSIKFCEGFNTSNVTTMAGMFAKLPNIFLDLSTFDTSNVTNMDFMFESSKLSTLDLSNFDTNNVTTMNWMFSLATNLQTIYVGPNWSTDGTSTYLTFNNCGTDHVTLKQ